MKKVFLKDLEHDRLLELLQKNDKLLCERAELIMEFNFEEQSLMSNYVLGKEWHKYIEYRDNYNSFYLVLKDYRKFLCNLDKDYLKSENIELYNTLIKKLDVLDNMDCYSENFDRLEEWLEEKSKILLEDVEKYLQGYEEYPSIEDVLEDLIDNEFFDRDYYILVDEETGKSDDIIRLDISYTQTFN